MDHGLAPLGWVAPFVLCKSPCGPPRVAALSTRWWIGLLASGCRAALFGCASHPGPWCDALTLVSANVTTAEHLPVLSSVWSGPLLLAVQEPRCSLPARHRISAALAASSVVPLWHAESGFVGAAVRGMACRLSSVHVAERLLPRICLVTAYRGGGSPVHVLCLYAPADGSAAALAAGVSLASAALARAAELGQAPVFIVGGFNQDPLPVVTSAELALSGWRGLAHDLGATSTAGRRVDRVYANSAASALVLSVSLWWDLGLSTHAAAEVRLRAGPAPCSTAAPARPRLRAPLR